MTSLSQPATALTFRAPSSKDGTDVLWDLSRKSGALDENSMYCRPRRRNSRHVRTNQFLQIGAFEA